MNDPEARIGHHWINSTHVTFGVVTAGFVYERWKIERSSFNGREPDQYRWNFDPLRLNSGSTRISSTPDDDWSLQASYGYIRSPEMLTSQVDQHRITASVTYNHRLGQGNWQTTLAWGRNLDEPGNTSDAVLVKSGFELGSTQFLWARGGGGQR